MTPRRVLLAAPALLPGRGAGARELADATGRRIALPSRIARVFPAGRPAAILAYTLAPDLLAGWPAEAPGPAEAAFLDPAAAALPALPPLLGPGAAPGLGAVLAARPELVLEYGALTRGYLELAESLAAQGAIPAMLLDGALGKIPETYLQLGDILGRPQAAEERASIADIILLTARQAAARLQARGRPRVFYAIGPQGTSTGLRGSPQAEILEFAGAEDVAIGPPGSRGTAAVTPEQVRAWDPDWIITLDPAFLRHARTDAAWQGLRAVREGRLALAPAAPFAWLDAPAAVNRLLGLVWLPVLFGVMPADVLPERVEAFHAMFYHRRPTAEQMTRLLADALPRR